jgi:hypothetical protein
VPREEVLPAHPAPGENAICDRSSTEACKAVAIYDPVGDRMIVRVVVP